MSYHSSACHVTAIEKVKQRPHRRMCAQAKYKVFHVYRVAPPKKIEATNFCAYLCQLLTDSQIFHWRILWIICNKVVTKHTTTP